MPIIKLDIFREYIKEIMFEFVKPSVKTVFYANYTKTWLSTRNLQAKDKPKPNQTKTIYHIFHLSLLLPAKKRKSHFLIYLVITRRWQWHSLLINKRLERLLLQRGLPIYRPTKLYCHHINTLIYTKTASHAVIIMYVNSYRFCKYNSQ